MKKWEKLNIDNHKDKIIRVIQKTESIIKTIFSRITKLKTQIEVTQIIIKQKSQNLLHDVFITLITSYSSISYHRCSKSLTKMIIPFFITYFSTKSKSLPKVSFIKIKTNIEIPKRKLAIKIVAPAKPIVDFK